ncbi:MAG: phosphate transport system regulatory protein PhoU [Candidatus Auribacter fodinae]|jgi:phosphate transport system protein|uniref:Phosphate-specific transport system accessory protein PhoU n=1 Tax=Candidatus Auribacter fodinae TaxID=2093366 RepID=A0A3A4QTG8_9BACT|nr:MAG: phosphate transport system regulatory protein PhoU [Candidatus Auribacter fodinae]
MSVHLIKSIEQIKKDILHLCANVEENLHLAVKSLTDRDTQLAEHVIKHDNVVDYIEVDIEEECLKILALHQPVAIDLRFIVAVLKINNDLERIGDLAVNIAEQAHFLSEQPKIDIPFDFPLMVEDVKTMLKKSIDALINMDAAAALEVCRSDDEVDAINRQMYVQVQEGINRDTSLTQRLLRYLSVSRYLERIADHATNIAEDVIYMISGTIVRHKPDLMIEETK